MESIWEILRLNETKDRAAIKRAYAALAGIYHPEECPQEFLRVREAYEKALAYAEAGADTGLGKKGLRKEEYRKEFQWGFIRENPFQNSPAIQRFAELYTGKRRTDRAAWLDYFTSEDFLEGYRESDFAALLLGVVRERQAQYPPNKEFLAELYIAYGLQYRYGQLAPDGNAAFSGIGHIMELAGMGAFVTRFKGNDFALAAGFRDYRELIALASKDDWDSDALLGLGGIVDRYQLANISDKPIPDAKQYELSQRHPKSLRLLTYFFAHASLPAQAYRILWNHLRLENATNGREKLLYGGLREAALAHEPKLLGMPRRGYQAIIGAEYALCAGAVKTAQEREEIDRFFAREDVRSALLDEIFVEEQVLHCWITKNSSSYYIERLEAFYIGNREAPYADRVLEDIGIWKKWKKMRTELEEDERSELAPCQFDFHKRAYVRYYLNTAFHQAYGVRNHVLLAAYLQQHMPYSAQWGRRLVDPNEGGFCAERSVEMRFGENVLNISFHRAYMEYLWNGKPCGALFSWENLVELEDEAGFWLLLPAAAAPITAYPRVYDGLVSRLSMLPIAREDIPVIADCIAGKLCGGEGNAEGARLVCAFYAETEELLYGCDIYEDGALYLYEEADGSKTPMQDGAYRAPDVDAAVQLGQRLLQELTLNDIKPVF